MIDKAIERERNALIEEIRRAKEEIVERLGEESDRVYERVGDAAANTMEALGMWLQIVQETQKTGFNRLAHGARLSLDNQASMLRDIRAILKEIEETKEKVSKTKNQIEMARLDFDLWRNS